MYIYVWDRDTIRYSLDEPTSSDKVQVDAGKLTILRTHYQDGGQLYMQKMMCYDQWDYVLMTGECHGPQIKIYD